MDNNSLSHTKWTCKYHIVFAPKFRRKVIYKQIRADIGHILSELCKRKGVEIYHIQGAGAPAKTKNYVNADAFIFFREKVRPFPHLAKPISRTFGKDEKSNGTDKKRLV